MKVYPLRVYIDALKDAGLLRECQCANPKMPVEQITYDSRAAGKNTLFCCKGAAFRECYLESAKKAGCRLYVSETPYPSGEGIAYLGVSDIRAAMALIASLFYDHPDRKLKLIGITGTKGKSTTAYYIKYILDEYLQSVEEKPCAILSSIDTYDGVSEEPSRLTTPEAFEFYRHLDNAVQSGIRYCVAEVSSQALKYHRVDGVWFDTGVFLNISEDHISPNEHRDFEDYFSSKLRLFSQCGTAVISADTEYKERVFHSAAVCKKVVTFSQSGEAEIEGRDILRQNGETRFAVLMGGQSYPFALTMPGVFNVQNALAAISVCALYGIPPDVMRSGLYKARARGRMEIFHSKDGQKTVIVDFAHNKLSFETLCRSTQAEFPNSSITAVFGCPGDRAVNRRAELGSIANRFADRVFLTADDPGFEDAVAICREIARSIPNREYHIIENRTEAIHQAIASMNAGDVVLVLGKGTENYQKVKNEYLPYLQDSYWAQKFLAEETSLEPSVSPTK